MTDKYTSNGLPVVSQDVIDMMNRDFERILKEMPEVFKDDDISRDAYFSSQFKGYTEMLNENEELHDYAVSLVQRVAFGEKIIDNAGMRAHPALALLMGFSLGYEALRRQLDVNQLEDSLNPNNPKS